MGFGLFNFVLGLCCFLDFYFMFNFLVKFGVFGVCGILVGVINLFVNVFDMFWFWSFRDFIVFGFLGSLEINFLFLSIVIM